MLTLLNLCITAGVFTGWLSIEIITVMGGGRMRMPWLLNAMASFIGGVSTYMICTKMLGM